MLIRRILISIFIVSLSIPLAAASIPRPEYPNPQAVRAEWMNLNGEWEFAETDSATDEGYLGEKPYPDKIIVPFCRESKLSGLGRTGFVKNVWYRRTFELPKIWKSPRTLLHIGACDYETTVRLNGKLLGKHVGGSAPITFEISKQLEPGTNTIIIHAFDDTRSGLQPTGKQAHSEQSVGCVYTRTTGIWQTVWLEGVGSSYIKDFRIEADPANSHVFIQAEVDGPSQGLTLKARVYASGTVVGTAQSAADWRNGRLVLDIPDKRMWSVDNPYLYDLELSLIRISVKAGKLPALPPVDRVSSYFGLRSVTIQGAAILINGKPVFQRLVLDQGFYPDGIWTAPTDDALRWDIRLAQACGYNGARLHQKVFEPRYLYWADKLGYLVWGEFPNWGLNYADPRINLPVINEWTEIVRRDRNHPAIIGWCPFNETPGGAVELQNAVVDVTRAIDPSRPIIDSSGYAHGLPDPEVLDAHDYDQNPETFRARYGEGFATNASLPARYGGGETRAAVPFMVSEMGGTGWSGAYGAAPKNLDEFYARYAGLVNAMLDGPRLFGFCYTQITDVEQEQNGLYTYDRKPKFDVKRIHAITSRAAAYEKSPPLRAETATPADWRVLVGAYPDKELSKEWRYAFDYSSARDWIQPNFDDSAWRTGFGGFGSKGGWEWATRTAWTTKDIRLRQEFAYDGSPYDRATLVIHYDNGTEVYLNGRRIWRGTGWNDRYGGVNVTKLVVPALKPGRNVIAVHTHQDEGGQFIDLAVLLSGK